MVRVRFPSHSSICGDRRGEAFYLLSHFYASPTYVRKRERRHLYHPCFLFSLFAYLKNVTLAFFYLFTVIPNVDVIFNHVFYESLNRGYISAGICFYSIFSTEGKNRSLHVCLTFNTHEKAM